MNLATCEEGTQRKGIRMTDNVISSQGFKSAFKMILDETFDNVHGVFLDKGDSLFPTLEEIDARTASMPVCGDKNSIASQVKHVIYYFEVGEKYMQGQEPGPTDWEKAWETVQVSDEEWTALKEELRKKQEILVKIIEQTPDSAFANDDYIGGAFGIVAHTAFHLGQIRHALCFINKQ